MNKYKYKKLKSDIKTATIVKLNKRDVRPLTTPLLEKYVDKAKKDDMTTQTR